MSCDFPVKAFPVAGGGRYALHTCPPGHSGAFSWVNCGKCRGCQMDWTRQWSLRCVHETRVHESKYGDGSSWFATFTFDPEHLPADQCVSKRDLQLLWKRFRKAGFRVRYVGRGEYGERDGRPHYHAILWLSRPLLDVRHFKTNRRGEKLYSSATLSKLWPFGYVTVGAVTPSSAAYVVGYMSKTEADDWESYALLVPGTGELVRRTAPFLSMSRRPGIGRAYVERFGGELASGDYLVSEGKRCAVPPYYTRVLAGTPAVSAREAGFYSGKDRPARKARPAVAGVDPALAEKLKADRQAASHSPEARARRRPYTLRARAIIREARFSRGRRGGGL